MEVRKAARATPPPQEQQGARLLSAEETTALRAREQGAETSRRDEPAELDAEALFAKLKKPKSEQN
jgi:hypothetical protein